MQKISFCGILVCTKCFTEFYKSQGWLTENVPFINHKNTLSHKMVAYTMMDVNSEQGQSVI